MDVHAQTGPKAELRPGGFFNKARGEECSVRQEQEPESTPLFLTVARSRRINFRQTRAET